MASTLVPLNGPKLFANGIQGGTYFVIPLLESWSLDPSDEFVADIVDGEAAGTDRPAVTLTVSADAGNNRTVISGQNVSFDTPDASQIVGKIAICRQVTDDNDSYPIFIYDTNNVTTTGANLPVEMGEIYQVPNTVA